MKPTTLLTPFFALAILAPVAALAAANCEPGNAQLTTVQRTAYIKQCLAESASPANVKRVAEQQKKMSCEQNARNKALQGTARADYITRCVYQNDARDAAAAMAAPKKPVPASLERNYTANQTAARLH